MGYLQDLKHQSAGKVILCFPGVGSAFAKKNHNTSLIIAKNGQAVLVDCGRNIPDALYAKGIGLCDFDGYHYTHAHSDHVGGVEELLLAHRYIAKRKPKTLITEHFQYVLWEGSLKGGCEYNESGLLRYGDLADPIRPRWVRSSPREMYHATFCGIDLTIFRTIHIPGDVAQWEQAFWSTGLLIERSVLFTADTRYDERLISDLGFNYTGHADRDDQPGLQAVFHDCQLYDPGTVHASYQQLRLLPAQIRSKTYLSHYGDTFDQFKPADDGFAGFAQPWTNYVFEL
jgi:hydroxyacylglutathione hydrolase